MNANFPFRKQNLLFIYIFFQDGNLRMFAGAMWFRLHLRPVGRRRSKKRATEMYKHCNSVFLLTFPGSPMFIMSRTGVQKCRLVLQVGVL